jgi:hypothetical protein
MTIPIAIFARSDVTYIHMGELSGKDVAVVDGYAVNDWIPRDFLRIRLIKVKNAEEGLCLVQKGKVFAYIDNVLGVSYYLAKLKVMNVKIAGKTPYVNAQSMAVRKDWPVLAAVLQKALDSISETERAWIYGKWIPVRYEHGFDCHFFRQAVAIFAVIILALVLWNQKLYRAIKQRRAAETALARSEHRFRQLFEAAAVPLSVVGKGG